MTFPSGPAAVSLDDISAGYGGGDVLKRLSATFRRGEVFVLLGPNGAGKSTMIRVLTGALKPREGRVSFAGARGAVGLAPQQIALYPWLSPAENCIAFGRLSGLSRGDCAARLASVLRLSGCEPVAKTQVARLSGGYQRRANIAAALMHEPDLLILDEPTAGLDAEGRAHVASVVSALQAAGAAILMVTHDFEFAEGLASRVGVLTGGRLACDGAPGDLIAARIGGAERIDFVLKQAPDATARARLAAMGAVPSAGTRAFRMRAGRARDAMETIEAAGWPLAEWRVRPAGLEDLYGAVLAGELAA